ncbi:hypothetical protein M0D21_11495 [Aquimarina sp. D1M17]|uniref:hypothetical protein n=1 Tax=Aquimarina acroporae TaxID=2937283 RepID=UPI0020BE94CA|nr:hypothetical protein [Aquimarina acroporae]MCK8522198.1 hypothetical protein [Aquimarina acroporae]
MANPKDIGKVFKEKLNDFNSVSSSLRWEDIEPNLPQKEKRPLLFWVKLGGLLVVASAMFFIIYNTASKNDPDSKNTIEYSSEEPCKEPDLNTNGITNSEVNTSGNKINTITQVDKQIDNNIKNEPQIITPNSKYRNSSTNKSNNISISEIKRPKQTSNINSRHFGREMYKPTQDTLNTDINSTKNQELSSLKSKKTTSIDNIATKDSLNISSQTSQDSVLVARKPKDTLIYMQPKKKSLFQKFSVGVHFGPTYTFTSKGSLISNQIADNTNSGRVSLSYGIMFKTYYSEKTALRIGYNRTKISSITKNVSSEQIPSILRDTGIQPSDSFMLQNDNSIDLLQKISYNEISLGLQHQIIDKDIKTSILLGMNALFLDNNTISIRTSSNKINAGSSRNLQQISLNFNVGSNFAYPITKSIDVTAEPIFNFQLKEASKNTESYKHFFITLQTGLSYKF